VTPQTFSQSRVQPNAVRKNSVIIFSDSIKYLMWHNNLISQENLTMLQSWHVWYEVTKVPTLYELAGTCTEPHRLKGPLD